MNSNKDTETQIFAFSPREILDKKERKNTKKRYEKWFVESKYVSGVKNLWKDCQKRIISGTLATAAALTICVAVSQLEWSMGYEVFIDGENIGLVTSKEVVFDAIDETRNTMKLHLGTNTSYEKEPVFVRRLVADNKVASKDMLKDQLLSNVDKLVKGYVVYVDGTPMFGVSDSGSAEAVLAKYKDSVVDEITDDTVVDFCEKVEIKNEYMNESRLKTPDAAFSVLSGNDAKGEDAPILSVKCVRTVELKEEVPFSVEKIDDSSVYEGETLVTREGQNGEQAVIATITTVNGVQTDKKIVSAKTITEPVSRIEKQEQKKDLQPQVQELSQIPRGGILSSRYGQRWDRSHNGIDIAGKHNSDIKAADGGIVTYAGWMDGYGNYVIIDHENSYQTAYGHCDSLCVAVGDRVAKGDVIAKMGNTGRSTGTHLHFEVKKDGVFVNPLEYVGY